MLGTHSPIIDAKLEHKRTSIDKTVSVAFLAIIQITEILKRRIRL